MMGVPAERTDEVGERGEDKRGVQWRERCGRLSGYAGQVGVLIVCLVLVVASVSVGARAASFEGERLAVDEGKTSLSVGTDPTRIDLTPLSERITDGSDVTPAATRTSASQANNTGSEQASGNQSGPNNETRENETRTRSTNRTQKTGNRTDAQNVTRTDNVNDTAVADVTIELRTTRGDRLTGIPSKVAPGQSLHARVGYSGLGSGTHEIIVYDYDPLFGLDNDEILARTIVSGSNDGGEPVMLTLGADDLTEEIDDELDSTLEIKAASLRDSNDEVFERSSTRHCLVLNLLGGSVAI